MENDKIHDYTDAYLESYLRALDKTHNPDLAIQTAMGVTMVLRMIDAQNEPKQPAQPQINPMAALFGAMMQQAAQNQQEEGSEIESDDDEISRKNTVKSFSWGRCSRRERSSMSSTTYTTDIRS